MRPADRAQGDAGATDRGGPAQGGGPDHGEAGAGIGPVQGGGPGVGLGPAGDDPGRADGRAAGGQAGQVSRAERHRPRAGQAEAVRPADRAQGDAGTTDRGVTGQGGGPGDGDTVSRVGATRQGRRAGNVQPVQISGRAQRNRGTGQVQVVTRTGDTRHVGTARRGEAQIAQQGHVAGEGEVAGGGHVARDARTGRAGGQGQAVDRNRAEPEGAHGGDENVLGIGAVADIDRAVVEREINRALQTAAGDGDDIVPAGHVSRQGRAVQVQGIAARADGEGVAAEAVLALQQADAFNRGIDDIARNRIAGVLQADAVVGGDGVAADDRIARGVLGRGLDAGEDIADRVVARGHAAAGDRDAHSTAVAGNGEAAEGRAVSAQVDDTTRDAASVNDSPVGRQDVEVGGPAEGRAEAAVGPGQHPDGVARLGRVRRRADRQRLRAAASQVSDTDGEIPVTVRAGPAADHAGGDVQRAQVHGEVQGPLKRALEIDPVAFGGPVGTVLDDVAVALDRQQARVRMDWGIALVEQAVRLLEIIAGGDQDVTQLQIVGAVGQIEGHATPGVVDRGRVANGDAAAVGDLDAGPRRALAIGDEAVDDGIAHAVQVQFGTSRAAHRDIGDREAVQHGGPGTAGADLDAIGRSGVRGRSVQGEVCQLHAAGRDADAIAGGRRVDDGGVPTRADQRDRLVDVQGRRQGEDSAVEVDGIAGAGGIDPALDRAGRRGDIDIVRLDQGQTCPGDIGAMGQAVLEREQLCIGHRRAQLAVEQDVGQIHGARSDAHDMLLGRCATDEGIAGTEVDRAAGAGRKEDGIGVVIEGVAREVHHGRQGIARADQQGLLVVGEHVVGQVQRTDIVHDQGGTVGDPCREPGRARADATDVIVDKVDRRSTEHLEDATRQIRGVANVAHRVVADQYIGRRRRLTEGDVTDRVVQQVVGEYDAGDRRGGAARAGVEGRPAADVHELRVGDRDGPAVFARGKAVTSGYAATVETHAVDGQVVVEITPPDDRIAAAVTADGEVPEDDVVE